MAKSQKSAATGSRKDTKSTSSSSLKETGSPRHPFEPLPEGHSIEFCFSDGGFNHFRLRDALNSFSARALDGLAVFEQWSMRCTPEYLRAHQMAIDNLINDKSKINLSKIADQNNKLGERLNFAIPTEDIIYKFAAVAIFDQTESPYRYDPSYGKKKIARWKESGRAADFFFMLRSKDLIPSPEYSLEDLNSILTTVNLVSRTHFQQVSSLLSSDQRKTDFFQELLYQQSLNSTGID